MVVLTLPRDTWKPKSLFEVRRLLNARTALRELVATRRAVQSHALRLLAPALAAAAIYPRRTRIPPQSTEALRKRLNERQYAAITGFLSQTPTTLVQGPPGTGKSHMIAVAVSAVLLSRFAPQRAKPQPSLSRPVSLLKQSETVAVAFDTTAGHWHTPYV